MYFFMKNGFFTKKNVSKTTRLKNDSPLARKNLTVIFVDCYTFYPKKIMKKGSHATRLKKTPKVL